MRNFLLRALMAAAALLIASYLFAPLLRVESVVGAIIFAIVLGLLNAVVRPILILLTLPLTLLTLGLFLLVVNALVFWLATVLPGGGAVEVAGFGGAFVGALAVTIVSMIGARLFDVR